MKKVTVFVMSAIVSAFIGMAAMGFTEFLASIYRTDSITCTNTLTTFTVAYTNDTGSKMAIASIFARSDLATNNWTLYVVNSGQTNVLSGPTAENTATSLKYEGYGNIPLGAGGTILLTGQVNTNSTCTVLWQLHFK